MNEYSYNRLTVGLFSQFIVRSIKMQKTVSVSKIWGLQIVEDVLSDQQSKTPKRFGYNDPHKGLKYDFNDYKNSIRLIFWWLTLRDL